ncbi:hypothetical protein MADRUGA_77 [Mycobacterium phage Madruga]|uniref:Uncharacterized protein n=1 Tax=Mycobacterium phage Madruga TaxID=1675552 RepID=A0A0K1LS38_9CAUD|nr:hypothetical protein MADRUGA_77 [Mycobacterium phage Madruga]
MTAVADDVQLIDEDTKGAVAGSDSDDDDDEDSKSRDFTKFTAKHEQIAKFINSNEDFRKAFGDELTVSPGLVKAVFALRTDFNNTPEQVAAREERRKRREEEKKKYEGLTPEQIKAQKAADRAEKQAARLQERLQAALAKAQALREGKDASGEDIAAAVAADLGEVSEDKPAAKRKIGRSR